MRVKRFLAGMLSVSMLSMMCAGNLAASADTLCGDADGSGNVNPLDCIEVLNYAAGVTQTGFAPEIADANADSIINECDAAAIAGYYMGKIDALPAEAPITVEPADPFPHEFGFSMDNASGFAGTTIPVNIYLDQSKDQAWLYELDAMRLSVTAEDGYDIKINSVHMNANFSIGNTDGTCVISGAFVKDEDASKPVATVYLEVGADVPSGTYAVDFVAEDCFIGNIYGQTADKVSFTGGSITVDTAPETLPTIATTIATTTTTETTLVTTETTLASTEVDFPEQTDFPDETTPVPDTTVAVSTEEAIATEETVAPEDGLEMTLSQNHFSHVADSPIWLDGITASVFSETDGYLVSAQPITNTDYFIVDDSRYNPSEPGYYIIYVHYADEAGSRLIEEISVNVYEETTSTEYTGETTTTSVATTTLMTHITTTVMTTTTSAPVEETVTETTIATTSDPVEETVTETTETPADTTFDPVGTVVTSETTWNTTLPTDTSVSGSDSSETIETTTSETADADGTDYTDTTEVNGTTAVGTEDTTTDTEVTGTEVTETTTASTEIAPEEPVETEASTEIAPEISETTETIVSDEASTETTASETDTEDVTTTEPEENLPQTGNPAWLGWMIAGTVLLMTAGGWMMVQAGILRKDEE